MIDPMQCTLKRILNRHPYSDTLTRPHFAESYAGQARSQRFGAKDKFGVPQYVYSSHRFCESAYFFCVWCRAHPSVPQWFNHSSPAI